MLKLQFYLNVTGNGRDVMNVINQGVCPHFVFILDYWGGNCSPRGDCGRDEEKKCGQPASSHH